jgi:hypothetical protein
VEGRCGVLGTGTPSALSVPVNDGM